MQRGLDSDSLGIADRCKHSNGPDGDESVLAVSCVGAVVNS
jgi:hypothetical protein